MNRSLSESGRSVSFSDQVRVREHIHAKDMDEEEKRSTWYSMRELSSSRNPGRDVQWKADSLPNVDVFEVYGDDPLPTPRQQNLLNLAVALRSPESSPAVLSRKSLSGTPPPPPPALEELQTFNESMMDASSPLMTKHKRKQKYLRRSNS